MLSRGVEAAREGTPQERESLEYLLFNLVRNISVKMNFFVEQGETAMNLEGKISENDVI